MPSVGSPIRHLFRALGALALAAGAARAQVAVLDQGIFSLTVGGQRVGREDFSIRRTLSDGSVTAQGNVLRGDTRSTVALTTDSLGTPLRFQVELVELGRPLLAVSGEFRRGGLWSGRAVRPGSESGREFRLPDPVTVADDGVVHHAWFVLTFGREGTTPRLDPRALTVRSVVVERIGSDTVRLGMDRLDAVRWAIREAPGGTVVREVWVDPGGRLLKVLVPAEDLVATRDDPPPETPPSGPAYGASEPNPNRNRY